MDLGLREKVALITGGTSGIGLAVAERLAAEGARIALCGRDGAKLDDAVARLAASGADVFGKTAHVDRAGDVEALVAATLARFGRIDVLVSNAGTHLAGRLEDVTLDQLEQHIRTKVVAPFALARAVVPAMRARGSGSIVVIIGQAAKVPGAAVIASAMVNAAQHAFVKALSDDAGRDNITVNAVCPSRIASPLTENLDLEGEAFLGRSLDQQRAGWGKQVPLGRWGDPEDIADAVAFFASDRARFIVGSNIDVDGGYQRMIF